MLAASLALSGDKEGAQSVRTSCWLLNHLSPISGVLSVVSIAAGRKIWRALELGCGLRACPINRK